MGTRAFYQERVERLPREELNALIDERVRYTIQYAVEHSPFYRSWFGTHGIDPAAIRTHEDLLELPIISGKTIREHQPPLTREFMFRSVA
jgi:phenylacetate-coenzyme A ligase PaaK-like adenylate-forming protein